jgi:hypothetical protein
LALERGQYLGAEFNKKGVSVALGPMVGPYVYQSLTLRLVPY